VGHGAQDSPARKEQGQESGSVHGTEELWLFPAWATRKHGFLCDLGAGRVAADPFWVNW
jgi:hypothetical protein